VAVFVTVFAILFAIHRAQSRAEPDPIDVGRIGEVISVLRERYVRPVDEEALVRSALEGMLSSLDPYCEFFDAEERQSFTEDTVGEYSGIGVIMRIEDGALVVDTVVPGGPAEAAGVVEGERLVAVDGERLPERVSSLRLVERRVKGPSGTEVRLLLDGVAGPRDVSIVRREIKKPSVPAAAIVDREAGIGYVRIRAFQENTPRDFDDAVSDLLADGLRALVLDLRFNPGGVLSSAVEIADRFLGAGLDIVSTRGRTSESNQPFVARGGNDLPADVPVAVLVNGESASAAEVVAGALKDHRRAILVGTKTFGKGLVQSVETLSDRQSLLKFTSARYYTPSGRCIDRRLDGESGVEDHGGIVPDFVVRLPARSWNEFRRAFAAEVARSADSAEIRAAAARSLLGERNDTQLKAALDLLRGRDVVQVFRRRPPAGAEGAAGRDGEPDTAEVDPGDEEGREGGEPPAARER